MTIVSVVSPAVLTVPNVTVIPLPNGTLTLLPAGVLMVGGLTVVGAVAQSLIELGSGSLPATQAVLVRGPTAVGVTMMVTLALRPLPRRPMVHVTVPAACTQLPRLEVADTKVTPAGRGSVRVTPVAREGPLLVTTIV